MVGPEHCRHGVPAARIYTYQHPLPMYLSIPFIPLLTLTHLPNIFPLAGFPFSQCAPSSLSGSTPTTRTPASLSSPSSLVPGPVVGQSPTPRAESRIIPAWPGLSASLVISCRRRSCLQFAPHLHQACHLRGGNVPAVLGTCSQEPGGLYHLRQKTHPNDDNNDLLTPV